MRDTWILMLGLSTVWACSLLGQNGCFYELSPLSSLIYNFSGPILDGSPAGYQLTICRALNTADPQNVSATQVTNDLYQLGRLPANLTELSGPPPANGSAASLSLHRLSLNTQKHA